MQSWQMLSRKKSSRFDVKMRQRPRLGLSQNMLELIFVGAVILAGHTSIIGIYAYTYIYS